jgi:PST family polysaccharide transporter
MPANQAWIQLLPPFLRSRLDGRYTLQKIVGNTGWLFADRILRMGVGLVVGVWIARYLGPEQFGLFNYAIAFVALITPLATLGLDGIVIRDIVRAPECRDETLGTAFVLKLLGGMLTLVLGTGIIMALRPQDTLLHWLVAIFSATTIFQVFDAIDFWFQSQTQSQYSVIARNIAFVVLALVRVVLIRLNAPLVAFAWAGLAETALAALGLLIAYRIQGNRLSVWRVSIARSKRLLQDSWSLMLSGIAILIYMKIDLIMLSELAGEKAVGIYSAATRLSEVWYFIPMAIVASASPAIIAAKQIDQKMYYQQMQRLFNNMTFLALSLTVPISFLSTTLVTSLFGNNYLESGVVLQIHIWSSIFVFLGVAQTPWDLAEELQKLAFVKTLIGAFINVLLNLFLIPQSGAMGAAIATLLSYAIVNYLLNLFIPRMNIIFKLQTRAIFLSWVRELK